MNDDPKQAYIDAELAPYKDYEYIPKDMVAVLMKMAYDQGCIHSLNKHLQSLQRIQECVR